jgi:hypothetical protein
VIWDECRGPEFAGEARASFLTRNLRRLPRLFRILLLLWYRGDVSCYDK